MVIEYSLNLLGNDRTRRWVSRPGAWAVLRWRDSILRVPALKLAWGMYGTTHDVLPQIVQALHSIHLDLARGR